IMVSPVLRVEKIDYRRVRGSLSGLGFAYCDFYQHNARAEMVSRAPDLPRTRMTSRVPAAAPPAPAQPAPVVSVQSAPMAPPQPQQPAAVEAAKPALQPGLTIEAAKPAHQPPPPDVAKP